MSKLIAPARVEIDPYFHKFLPKFRLAGFLELVPAEPDPLWKTWDKKGYNSFENTACRAKLDGKDAFVVPVFVNDARTDFVFDTETGGYADPKHWTPEQWKAEAILLNTDKPFIAYFMGNDDWSYGLRFTTAAERDTMISTFGAEIGTLQKLLGQN